MYNFLGAVDVFIVKMHEHVSKKINSTTTIPPKIIEKRSLHFDYNDSNEFHSDDKINCGCSAMADSIAEHVVKNVKSNKHRKTDRELEEVMP